MKQYKTFVKDYCDEGGMGFIEDDIDILNQHFGLDEDDSENVQLESLSSMVSAVAGGITIKSKSLLSKLRSEKDGFKKQDILGQMILLSTYGSMVGAAGAMKNQSIIRKLMGGKRR